MIDKFLPFVMPLRAAKEDEVNKVQAEREYLSWDGQKLVTAFDLLAAEFARRFKLNETDARHRAYDADPELYDLSERFRSAVVDGGMHLAGLPLGERQAVERFFARLGVVEHFEADDTPPVDPFAAAVDKVLVEQFKGDVAHYSDAMHLAAERYPDLAASYVRQGRK